MYSTATPKEKKGHSNVQNNNEISHKENDNDLEVLGAGFASETTEQEVSTFRNYCVHKLEECFYRKKLFTIIS